MQKEDFIVIGKTLAPFGVRGEIKVKSFAQSPDRFKKLPEVYIGDKPYTVESAKIQDHNTVILSLGGIDDRDAASDVRGDVYMTASLLEPTENEVYIRDLRGLKVYEKDEYIGEILRAEIIAGRELYLIKLPDGKELLLPCTAEFIKTIDMQDRKMQVVLPAGIMETAR